MTTTQTASLTTPAAPLGRIAREGWGPGAWHGPDLRAALSDVTPAGAFWRPAPGRHNIAEVALHHAWFVRSVIGQISGIDQPSFPLAGSDWFERNDAHGLDWGAIVDLVDAQHQRLAATLDDIAAGRLRSPVSESELLDQVLGITCHAIYHAGQVQLVKVLGAAHVL
jgi:hypothetical protein